MIVYSIFDVLQALSCLTGLCELTLSIEVGQHHPNPALAPPHDDNTAAAAAATVPSGHVIGGDAGTNGGISVGTLSQLEAAFEELAPEGPGSGCLHHLSRLKRLKVGSHYLLLLLYPYVTEAQIPLISTLALSSCFTFSIGAAPHLSLSSSSLQCSLIGGLSFRKFTSRCEHSWDIDLHTCPLLRAPMCHNCLS